jgi:hypothetical protein
MFYCQTVSFDMGGQLPTATSTSRDDEKTLLYAGIFGYQDPQKPYSCLSYDNLVESQGRQENDGVVIVDPKWKAIKVISVFSLFVGSVLTVVSILLPCRATTIQQDRCRWNVVGVVLLAVLAVSQFVTIVVLRKSYICNFHRNPAVQFYHYNPDHDGGSVNGTDNNNNNDDDDQCHWAAGLVLLVVASAAFALAGIAVFLLPTPSSSWVSEEPRQTQQVTYERTVHPDGTVTVEKVQVVIGVVET